MKEIRENLYQFSVYIPPMGFTIHNYLLNTDPAILFAAGTVQQAEAILPELKEILNGKPLKYVFVSHMESDEVGGLFVLQKEWPELTVICGELSARELFGYGFKGNILTKHEGDCLEDGELNLSFIDYPAEVHLQNGLLCQDNTSGILYSADLFLRFGNGVGEVIDSEWRNEVAEINDERIPNDEVRANVQNALMSLTPSFIAVGHGFCINCA